MGDDGTEHPGEDRRTVTWAALFDLLSSEYGWTDEQILELTLGRLRLAVRHVSLRQQERQRMQIVLAESIVKGVVGAMPAIAFGRKAGASVAKYAREFSLLPREKRLPQYETMVRLFGGR